MAIDYKQAGVDVEAGDALVDWLQASGGKKAHADRVVSGIGGFASLFRIDFPQMKKPCLITCTDGVGTKVKIASRFRRFEGVGQDLVAMCVNDLICCGGEPLQFLDYYAVGKLDLADAKAFLDSVRRACDESDCALTGGETAEMPGVYQAGDFDCAGFAVGIVDQEDMLGPQRVRVGDVLIGVSSSGFHSNGYSLLRRLFESDLEAWADELLKPTALYVRLMKDLRQGHLVHAAAHITGGGIDNIPRALPEGTVADIGAWDFPPAFAEAQKRAGLDDLAMMKTLNCGIGFVLVAPSGNAAAVRAVIEKHRFRAYDLGQVVAAADRQAAADVRVRLKGEGR
ncbi:MAG: phosphoribosylformylglycinamidine cyclo-ligase [Bdellovibrionaceae bacterium]|nr:phosphoribosylformylglycinamidine cyclo-ligase [Pseudobdellovibrionaceae bacterium]MBX3035130.1 phosphoribosylformylglycinamidine cyclo-ligase [Pseudobdellovibrionaceae bacterium]